MSGTDQVQLTASSTQAGGTKRGDSPGLYGGTRHAASCNPAKLVEFLGVDTEKAKAWAAVHKIKPHEIARFVGRLTPVWLRTDTLVTNHGIRDGKPTKSPAVLQAGMGVLVNEYGFPVVKCNCGNPLTKPEGKISSDDAEYTGHSWPHFSKGKVTKIKPREFTKSAVTVFILVDPEGKIGFDRPRGTLGTVDGPPEALPPTETKGPPTDGTGTPTDGTGTPTDGTGTPTDGTGTPTDGTGTPTDGTGTPTDGTGAPTDGTGTPTDGTGTPTDGTGTPTDGTGNPTDGTGTPTDGAGTPTNGNGTDDNTPTDGTGNSTSGPSTPANGDGVPSQEPTSEPEAPVAPSSQQTESQSEPTIETSTAPEQPEDPVPS
ncbi:DUF6777 domain-containing protein [Actinomadura sp. 6N118]|uniref:DUF6777 domain-containing protein n=1 Tax=Actinomadura sp. 6N118 TaxID=3375151 RepID=UPI0037B6E619